MAIDTSRVGSVGSYGLGVVSVGWAGSGATGITLTGTAAPTQTEADIVTGGKTIILTLAGDTFVTGTTSEDAIAGGSNSDQASSGTNWNAIVKNALDNTDVVISTTTVTNDTATITLPSFGTYDTPVTEIITWEIVAASLTISTSDIIATPTHTVTAVGSNLISQAKTISSFVFGRVFGRVN